MMAMKGYSAFPKALALLELHHQIVLCHIQDIHWQGRDLTTLTEMQSVYSATPADWAMNGKEDNINSLIHIGTFNTRSINKDAQKCLNR